MRDLVLVLNFSDTASRTITRKLRSERVMCRIVSGSVSPEEIMEQQPLGLVLACGTENEISMQPHPALFDLPLPMLAIGRAADTMLQAMGGSKEDAPFLSGLMETAYSTHPLFDGLENGDRMVKNIRPWLLSASTRSICTCEERIVGFTHKERPLMGLQLEMEQSDMDASLMLRNFALSICGCTPWWDDDAFVSRAEEEIRRITGDGIAVCAMTGGLDSGVSALLGHRALGDRLKCIFVDTGLLRENEVDDFLSFYREQMGLDILCVNAKDRFLSALQGVESADKKRNVIGLTMQQILTEEKHRLGHYNALIKGTSFNDIMFGKGDRRPQLAEDVPLMEPVRDLFKDEIRRIGNYLGIPAEVLSRQPFPGSGLALRIMGEVTEEKLQILRKCDHIFREEIISAGAEKRLWQYFAVLSPLPGSENQTAVCLRAVHASEQNLAYAARLPYDVTENTTTRILQEVPQVQRVLYDLTPSGRYAGIEWQ